MSAGAETAAEAGGDISSWLVRYQELRPCTTAFIDTRTPGSHLKENFTIIGPGVSESPEQHVHITEPHGFNIGAARQPSGCVNSQHSHETAEVFIVHSGEWEFTLGVNGDDGSVRIGPGDTISIPIHVFRGFRNVGDSTGFLFAVLGEDDPGHVTWAPYVFEAAASHGLVLLEDGSLVDTSKGQLVPAGARRMPATSKEDVDRMRRMSADELQHCVMSVQETDAAPATDFTGTGGIRETSIIGPGDGAEGTPAGKMAWPHGFNVRRLTFAPGSETRPYRRAEHEVLLIHRGHLRFDWPGGSAALQPGDVLTVPVGLPRRFANASADTSCVYVVRGGDRPEPCEPAEL